VSNLKTDDLKEFFDGLFGSGTYSSIAGTNRSAGQAIVAILCERRRQDELKAKGAFKYTCADPEMADTEKLCVLAEEFGEAARAVLALEKLGTVTDYGGESGAEARKHLRKELVQCGAVIVAWLECIEWEMKQPGPEKGKE